MDDQLIETKHIAEIGKHLIVCPNCGSTKDIVMSAVWVDKPTESFAVYHDQVTEIEIDIENDNIEVGGMNLTFNFNCGVCNNEFWYELNSEKKYVTAKLDMELSD
jgi:DNA-directed RNA polymerase subunit M/transcription elongation factor TFIIS